MTKSHTPHSKSRFTRAQRKQHKAEDMADARRMAPTLHYAFDPECTREDVVQTLYRNLQWQRYVWDHPLGMFDATQERMQDHG